MGKTGYTHPNTPTIKAAPEIKRHSHFNLSYVATVALLLMALWVLYG